MATLRIPRSPLSNPYETFRSGRSRRLTVSTFGFAATPAWPKRPAVTGTSAIPARPPLLAARKQRDLDNANLSINPCAMPIPDLDDLIAEVDRTCTTAVPGNDNGGQPNWIELLKTAAAVAGQLQALADDLVEEYVEHCRMHGSTWSDVGEALGVSRQAAQQRFLAPPKDYDSAEFSEELRAAMNHMKRVAVLHRNNFIGTEHVLAGVLAETNSATARLTSSGVALDELRQALESRLGLGASQAADRIAWTPYARKVIAIAKQRAQEMKSETMACEHVLAGLLILNRGVAADVLNKFAISRAAIEPKRSAWPSSTPKRSATSTP